MSTTVRPGPEHTSGRAVEMMLGADAASARRARRFVTDSLHRMGRGEHADTAALLVSELVTNALVHTQGEIVVRVVSDATRLRVEVRDSSPVPPVMRARNTQAEDGRGMLLVEKLSDGWGADPGSEGKVVWFELADPPRGPTLGAAAAAAVTELFPRLLHEAPAAVLVVDLARGEVTYANTMSREMTGALQLPVKVDDWAEAAGLQAPGGHPLGDTTSPLSRIAGGHPVAGEPVTARFGAAGRRAVWVTGFPLTGVSGLEQMALVVLFQMTPADTDAEGDLRVLRERAVVATDISFTVSDPHQPDNPLVWTNPAFARTTGYDFDEVVGRNCRILQGPDTDPAAVQELRDAQAERRATTVTLLNYRKDGTAFWNELSLSPVFDSGGELTHFVGVQADVTARVQAELERAAAHDAEREARAEAERARAEAEQAQRQLALLAEATTLLSATLDVDTALGRLAELAVPQMADWCAVDLLDESGAVRRVASGRRQRSGSGPAARQAPGRRRPAAPAVAEVLRDGKPVLLPELAGNPTAVLADPEEGDDPRLAGCRSAMVLPLQARDRMLGAVTLVATTHSGRRFDQRDLERAVELVQRAGLAVDNARLYMREHSVAEALQRSLLPTLVETEGVDTAARYLAASVAAEVGGDWYDVLELPDGALGLAIGDVMGHDLAAAAAMGQLRSVLRSYAWEGDATAIVLDRLDRLVQGLGMAQLATAIYARLEPATGDGPRLLHYANAGHLPPLVQSPDGAARYLEGGQSVLLGAPSQGHRPEAVEPLPTGSTLLLYTDGLVERRGIDLEVGLALLRDTVAAVDTAAGPSRLCDQVLAELIGDSLADDVALLAVRVR